MFKNSLELLAASPLGVNDPSYDKFFLTGHISRDQDRYNIVIDENAPAVRLNDKVPGENKLVKEMALDPDYSLFSANSCVWIKTANGDKLPVFTRDEGAPVYPNCDTIPAGRCDQLPKATALAVLNQEIAVVVHNSDRDYFQLAFGSEYDARIGQLHQERMTKKALAFPQLLLSIDWVKGPHSYEVYTKKNNLVDGQSFSHSNLVEKGECWVIYDQQTNAYEFCFIGEVSLPDGYELISIRDGDGFGRPGRFISSFEELDPEKCVPALRGLIEFLK